MDYVSTRPTFNRLQRGIALVLLVTMTACTSMQPVASPKEFLQTRKPPTVWLSRDVSQAMVAMDGPRLQGDSIVGFVEGEYTEIPLSNVKAMQARQYSKGKTTAFVVGVTGVVIGALLLVKAGLGGSEDMTGEDDIGIIRH
jgi:hypothetical protein